MEVKKIHRPAILPKGQLSVQMKHTKKLTGENL